MKLIPIVTEKSLKDAKAGRYTFTVLPGFNKAEIRKAVEGMFKVHVTGIATMNYRGGTKRNFRGQIRSKAASKKAIVTLAKDEKIDLFEEKKK
ncbi:MAG: 50S ribosomal protein L23 [Candidatus Woesebacteria bacterium GW2011_GWA1_45_8]|uniref:Large ribosomal subunit protein uL23 n=1 Tax=Candidatus Woesebacteria bacterium GW2011_GWA1_45_8 TaxID=1618559 RepID=A0A0G1MVG0_9BACT|nr:MAG: 50S ribosomal protein L23 [Candidatus Woesebacteria bacterium GW2011_GWA1_45_8]